MEKKMSHADSRRMYSWWWDSHVSPKNSKWLQENLTDMDAKVKSMIKLIEEDADSFARRAEMYYKKRPELMKMVEEFYRAYRALAERYDHATGVIRHAHRTMAEAFPNQVPMMFADDSPANAVSEDDPRMYEMSMPNGDFTDESDSVPRRRNSKQFNGPFGPVERVRRGLNFDEEDDKEESMQGNDNNHVKSLKLSRPDQESESEEILHLKEAIAKLEAEKEAGLTQYQQSLDKLSQLEADISRTREDYRVLSDQANKAENEVTALKEMIMKLESEKECKLQEYQQCLEDVSNLQAILSTAKEDTKNLSKKANTAEIEVQSLKGELDKLSVEKDAALNQYMQSLEMISSLENKLRITEEDAKRLKERAEKAESEVEVLKQTVSKLTEEKEALFVQYQQCLETISLLEHKLACAREEIDDGISKVKGAEEKCVLLERNNQTLHSDIESLMLKMGTQSEELTEKQKEVGRLLGCIQQERLRFVEAETAFQTLQHLHAQTQGELRAMASELQNRAQLLKVAETEIQSLQDELLNVKQENKHLIELNASSALSIKDMQNDISSLMDSKGKLEEEVELRLDQRNALQQEIYCLKEEINDLNKKHISIFDQVREVGLNPTSLGSSVKELQEENLSLKETCNKESSAKAALLEKLVIFEQLIEKNSVLETSISDLNAELEAVRGKMDDLEQSCQCLLKEKSCILDEKLAHEKELQETKMNLEEMSENNTVLVNSLSNAHLQLEALREKAKVLEDSRQLLANEKTRLITENDGLTSQVENARIELEDLGEICGELEERCLTLEMERELTLRKAEELQMYLEADRQEHASYIQITETRFSGIEAEMHLLQEECQWRKQELEQALDNALDNEIEIFVLRSTAQGLKENNSSLLVENQKLSTESSLSEKKILQLEQKNFEREVEIKSLSDQANGLRVGTGQLLKLLDIAEDHAFKDKTEQDQFYVDQLLGTLQIMKESICKAEEDNLRWNIDFSVLVTWIMQVRLDLKNLLEMNEELMSKLMEADSSKASLGTQVEDLNRKLMDMQDTCEFLQRERSEIFEEKRCLADNLSRLEKKNNVIEEENFVLSGNVLALENLSLIFRSSAGEKFMSLRELEDDLNKLHDTNSAVMGNLSVAERSLEESKIENFHLTERLQKSEDELKVIAAERDQLSDEIRNGKELLHQMVIELKEAEQAINLLDSKKLAMDKSVESLRKECDEVKMDGDHHEIVSLEECVSSLENHQDTHIKTQNPENEKLQGAQVTCDSHQSVAGEDEKALMPSTGSDLHDLFVRLQAFVKKAVDIQEQVVLENVDLRSRLDASMRQLELLQSESGRYRRNSRPTSEITEADNALLMKDIVLDQISDGSSYGVSKREPLEMDNQIGEACETSYPDGTISPAAGNSKEIVSPMDDADFRRVKSMEKQKSELSASYTLNDDLSMDKLEISKRFRDQGNKRKVLERLDSDVQKLANLQITVQDLKRKLEVTEKGKRGKAVTECEALKGQLEEADTALLKLFDLNGRLMTRVSDSSFSDTKSSFDLERDESAGRRRVSEQARRMSEKIGRLQLEVQKLQFVLLKLDDQKEGKIKTSGTKRAVLRDYLYGRARIGQSRKKAQCCLCIQPSTIED